MPAGECMKTEHEEQREFVSWWRKTRPETLIFAVPNGGYRSPQTAARLKVEGVIPGIPDLCVPRGPGGLPIWIEMKRSKGGKLSAAQRSVIDYLRAAGHSVIVAHGCDDAIRQVTEIAMSAAHRDI